MGKPESKLEEIKAAVKLAMESSSDQRLRERDDLAFQVAENQWPEDAKKQRSRYTLPNGVEVPARPMVSVSQIDHPMRLVKNQAHAARLGVNLHPVSEHAEQEIAETKQGLYRRIERDGGADQARMWAFDRAVQAGVGWYLVTTQYDEDGDNEFDQEIVFERILYQDMVYIDPSAQKADFSDARYGGLGVWMSADAYREEFPDGGMPEGDREFEALVKDEPMWVRSQGDKKGVFVVTHFYKVFERKKVRFRGQEREAVRVSVKVCKASAWKVLEESDWNGKHIPLIPVVGRELQPFDQERRWEGMVRPARGAQMVHNYAASTLVERLALEPKVPVVGYAGQFEGFEPQWLQANIRNFPYLEVNPVVDKISQQVLPLPERLQIDHTGASLATLAIEQSKDWIQTTTAVYAPSLGDLPKRKESQSGRAILALQQQTDAGTSDFIQNLATITLPYEARVVLDLMPVIYDRPGRVTQVLGGEDDERVVMLNRPFTVDPRTGRPVAARKGAPGSKVIDLAKQGKYSVSIDIGKSFQTRLQQGQQELGELLPGLPPQAQLILLPTYMRFRDTPGAKEASELLKKYRDMVFPGLADDENKGYVTPEELEAKVQAQSQQLQMVGQQLQMAVKAIETDQAKQQAMLVKTQMEIASKERIAAADNETKLAIEGLAQRMEGLQALLQQSHERAIHHEDMAHDVAMAAGGSQTMKVTRGRGREDGGEREGERSQGRSQTSGQEASNESGGEDA